MQGLKTNETILLSPCSQPESQIVKSHFRCCRPILLLDEDPTLELKTLVWGTNYLWKWGTLTTHNRADTLIGFYFVIVRCPLDSLTGSVLISTNTSPTQGLPQHMLYVTHGILHRMRWCCGSNTRSHPPSPKNNKRKRCLILD